MSVYYPSSLRGCCFLGSGLLFIGFGLCGISASGLESLWFFGAFCLVGLALGVVVGLAILSGKVVVNEQRIATYHLGRQVHKIPWHEIQAWSVKSSRLNKHRDDDSFTYQVIDITLRDGRCVSIFDDEVGLPRFDLFIADIRNAVGEKDVCKPGGDRS